MSARVLLLAGTLTLGLSGCDDASQYVDALATVLERDDEHHDAVNHLGAEVDRSFAEMEAGTDEGARDQHIAVPPRCVELRSRVRAAQAAYAAVRPDAEHPSSEGDPDPAPMQTRIEEKERALAYTILKSQYVECVANFYLALEDVPGPQADHASSNYPYLNDPSDPYWSRIRPRKQRKKRVRPLGLLSSVGDDGGRSEDLDLLIAAKRRVRAHSRANLWGGDAAAAFEDVAFASYHLAFNSYIQMVCPDAVIDESAGVRTAHFRCVLQDGDGNGVREPEAIVRFAVRVPGDGETVEGTVTLRSDDPYWFPVVPNLTLGTVTEVRDGAMHVEISGTALGEPYLGCADCEGHGHIVVELPE